MPDNSYMVNIIDFENQKCCEGFCSLLSLCKRAGQLVSGEAGSENAVKSKKAAIVFLSVDASANTIKKFSNKCKYYDIPVFMLHFSKGQLGQIIGESQRSVIAVTGGEFAKRFIEYGNGF